MKSPCLTATRLRDDEGLALVLALLFVVLLAVIVVEFAYEMQVDATLITEHSSNSEAYLAARSAVALSMSVLAADLLLGEDEAQQQQSEVGFYDSLDEPWYQSTPIVQFNDATVSIHIEDEYGKLNLNALVYEDGGVEQDYEPLVEALTLLFEARMPGASPVDAILDWLDADDEPRPGGFENGYYQNLETPYECKNGPMDSLEELLLIPGITPEVYFSEFEEDIGLLPLPSLFTVHGHPEGKININTASDELLEAVFSVDPNVPDPLSMTDSTLQRLEEVGPFTSIAELRSEGIVPDPEQDENQNANEADDQPEPLLRPDLFDVRSSVFRIQGDSEVADTMVRIDAVVWRDTPQEGRDGGLSASGAAQFFRILEWRIVQ
jgi:general secretion pathway protein K